MIEACLSKNEANNILKKVSNALNMAVTIYLLKIYYISETLSAEYILNKIAIHRQ